MKRIAAFLLAAQGLFAADFVTGQAARAVIGQKYFTTEDNTSSDTVLGGASGLAYANGSLIVADANRVSASPINHRVVIYRDINAQIPGPTVEVQRNGLQRCPLCGFKADVVVGQTNFIVPEDGAEPHLSQSGLRLPTSVASDGVRLAVADTDNNRVLIWNRIPHTNDMPADLVLGQKDFTSGVANAETGDVRVPSARSLRGPQGVWIQDNMLFVADNQNHRVLIWRTFPTESFQPADVVLGQPNMATSTESDLTQQESAATPTSLLNPVAVTSDGVRLFVTDLGHNRVLIWNTIPTQNTAPADIALGQPDLDSGISNNSYKILSQDTTTGVVKRERVLCDTNGEDTNGDITFPTVCGATLSFPRYALSDGTRLFIADGGNDRVLVYKTIPTTSGAKADVVLGQISDVVVQTSDNTSNPDYARAASAHSMRTPSSLAWDGTNLFISDPYSRRVLVYTPGDSSAVTPVRNAASLEVYAIGSFTVTGTVNENDEVTATIEDREYTYKAKKNDTLAIVTVALANLINAGRGDASVFATAIPALGQVRLTAKLPGELGNDISLTTESSNSSGLTLSSTNPSGGMDAAKLAAGSLITIFGEGFTTETASAPSLSATLPKELAGVQLYVDGIRAPLLYVGPKQINAQLPFEVLDATSCSLYIRTKHADGSVTVSNAVGVPLIPANPGLFAGGGNDPRPAVAVHSSSYATASILISGTAVADDIATVKIGDVSYSYTLVTDDTLTIVRDKLIALINASDPKVRAEAGTLYQRIRLFAKQSGTAGNGITYSATSEGGNVVMSASSTALCCASVAGALVTEANPAISGETITFYATGLGMVNDPAKFRVHTGMPYPNDAPLENYPDVYVSALVGGKTANVLSAAMLRGAIGIYRVDLELNSDVVTDTQTQATIAQDVYVSNVVTIPVKKP